MNELEYYCKIPKGQECDGVLDCTECPYFKRKVGRPKGSTKPPTVPYHRRVRAEWVKILDELLKELKGQAK
jgi:hypothetical protein